jgi:predicted  nucleic acid-binding Zn-ribbon protein
MSTKTKDERLEEIRHRIDGLETRLKKTGDDKQAFTDTMESDRQDFKALFKRLEAKAGEKSGAAREQADASISDLKGSQQKVSERLAELREASGAHWHERRDKVTSARGELKQKLDEAMKRTFS